MLVGVGASSLCGERTKDGSPCGASWLGGSEQRVVFHAGELVRGGWGFIFIFFFSSCGAGEGLGVRTCCGCGMSEH